jgi:hypothetical protein
MTSGFHILDFPVEFSDLNDLVPFDKVEFTTWKVYYYYLN